MNFTCFIFRAQSVLIPPDQNMLIIFVNNIYIYIYWVYEGSLAHEDLTYFKNRYEFWAQNDPIY